MASTPLEYITLRALYFASDSRINDLIDEAEKETGSCFGDVRYKAVALLVMHWMELEKRAGADGSGSGATGTVKSVKEGDLSISYGSSSNVKISDPYLLQTAWGIELYNLARSKIFAVGNRFGL